MQKLFENAWKALYPGLIEWVPVGSGGGLASVDPKSRTLSTDFDKYEAAVANVIPPQKGGHLAELAGVADRTGWCPVDPVTFESKLQPNIHVIGDAAIAGAMPRSASAAGSQANICAAGIAALLSGKTPAAPTLTSSCFSLLAPDYAISQRGTYRVVEGQYNESEPGIVVSPLNATADTRNAEAKEASAWYTDITTAVFG
jgi:NADPH-dependent 2,4-dienoyl-CoA reductase/sulfur reductase-like enzyme